MKNVFLARYNSNHVLHRFLPQPKTVQYNLRKSTHYLTLPTDVSAVIKQNFVYRMLFSDINQSINQSVNQSTNQPTNQPTNKTSIELWQNPKVDSDVKRNNIKELADINLKLRISMCIYITYEQ